MDLLLLAEAVATEFKKRRMDEQLRLLRAFYASHRKALEAAQTHRQWTAEAVLRWAALLQIPPLQHVYEVHADRSGCPSCHGDNAIVRTRSSWTGGALFWCGSCDYEWLMPPR